MSQINESTKNKGKSTADFINDAKKKHGDLYVYNKVDYKNTNTLVIITCKKHGDFPQRPSSHIKGAGCKKCATEQGSLKKTFTKEKFIEKAKLKHGDVYDYSLVDYKGSQENVIIICKKHGNFNQKPNNHLQGDGCRSCSSEKIGNLTRKTNEQFIKESIEKHGDTYIYDKVIYVSTHSKVIIVCKKHGDFLQNPSDHLTGRGCPECGKIKAHDTQRFTKEIFIERANEKHNNKYTYEKVNYIDSQTKVSITCKIHGDFDQVPNSHLQGYGCNLCAIIKNTDKQRLTQDQVVERAIKVHGDLYDYSKVVYVKNTEPVIIICKKHGEFLQKPNHHVSSKAGCKNCTMHILTKDEFLEKIKNIHGDKYTYEDSIIKSHRDEIIINCKKHGKFNQTMGNHLEGKGCISCGVESMSIKKKIVNLISDKEY